MIVDVNAQGTLSCVLVIGESESIASIECVGFSMLEHIHVYAHTYTCMHTCMKGDAWPVPLLSPLQQSGCLSCQTAQGPAVQLSEASWCQTETRTDATAA